MKLTGKIAALLVVVEVFVILALLALGGASAVKRVVSPTQLEETVTGAKDQIEDAVETVTDTTQDLTDAIPENGDQTGSTDSDIPVDPASTDVTASDQSTSDQTAADQTVTTDQTGSGDSGTDSKDSVSEKDETAPDSTGLYAYQTLSEKEQKIYQQMEDAIANRKSNVALSAKSTKAVDKVLQAIRSDHEEYFWFDGSYQYQTRTDASGKVTELTFSPVFNVDAATQAKYQGKIDASAKELLAGLAANASDFEKVRYVYATIIETTKYDLKSEHNQNLISTFVNHSTVCQGYAYGAQYLLKQLGISCTTINGTGAGEPHAWSLVKMDGDYYFMDVTWGENDYWNHIDANKASKVKDYVNYDYLGVSEKDSYFMKQHVAFDAVPLPSATAMKDNYFVHEGLYFDSFDKKAIGAVIKKAYKAGEPAVAMKFSSKDLYNKAFKYFVTDGHFAEYCGVDYINYMDGSKTRLMQLKF